MFSRRQPTASYLERRRAAVAVVCDIFAKGFSERNMPRRSALASRRGLSSACYGLGADLAVHNVAISERSR